MILCKFTGGLGNQMFQYAFGRSTQLKHKTNLIADISGYEEPQCNHHEFFQINTFPNISLKKAHQKQIFFYKRQSLYSSSILYNTVCKLFKYRNIDERTFNFDPNNKSNTTKNCYLKGYWQSEQYFIEVRNELLNDFKFPDLTGKNKNIRDSINDTNSCSLHIRRGDYVTNTLNIKNHGFIGLEYYKNAIDKIQQIENNLSLYIFSDDIDWVKSNLVTKQPTSYIDWNTGKDAIHDMHLMSLCKHNIIANSSFSWWAAWLNNNPNKMVFAPKRWFNERDWNTTDLIPKTWIRL